MYGVQYGNLFFNRGRGWAQQPLARCFSRSLQVDVTPFAESHLNRHAHAGVQPTYDRFKNGCRDILLKQPTYFWAARQEVPYLGSPSNHGYF